MCQGKLLKAAASRALSMCATGTTRKHLQGYCRLYKLSLGSLTCVTCCCGAVSIWASGEALRAPSSWSTRWTEMTDEEMKSVVKGVCISLSLPLPRSMTISPNMVAVQRQLLAQYLRALLDSSLELSENIARIDETMGRELGLPWPYLDDAMAEPETE